MDKDTKPGELIWSPIHERLSAYTCGGDPTLVLISPFITLGALQRFLESSTQSTNIKVIVRWRPEDLWAGASDIAIYPYLAQRNIPLYVNHDIHLKLYVFESNIAFCTSGNLTLRGFGYIENGNIEVGSFIRLSLEDWSRLYELIKSSKQVDSEIYQRYLRLVESWPKFTKPSMPLIDLFGAAKSHTIASLPAMENPARLAEYYFAAAKATFSSEETRHAAHDFVTFNIVPGLDRAEFEQRLRGSFRNSVFVVEFVDVLKQAGSLSFGAVNGWIHRTCEDVPLPYRWEIKTHTRVFYNWLECCFDEITWDRPNYSQVIYWNAR